jgi:hypothetical protein
VDEVRVREHLNQPGGVSVSASATAIKSVKFHHTPTAQIIELEETLRSVMNDAILSVSRARMKL